LITRGLGVGLLVTRGLGGWGALATAARTEILRLISTVTRTMILESKVGD